VTHKPIALTLLTTFTHAIRCYTESICNQRIELGK